MKTHARSAKPPKATRVRNAKPPKATRVRSAKPLKKTRVRSAKPRKTTRARVRSTRLLVVYDGAFADVVTRHKKGHKLAKAAPEMGR